MLPLFKACEKLSSAARRRCPSGRGNKTGHGGPSPGVVEFQALTPSRRGLAIFHQEDKESSGTRSRDAILRPARVVPVERQYYIRTEINHLLIAVVAGRGAVRAAEIVPPAMPWLTFKAARTNPIGWMSLDHPRPFARDLVGDLVRADGASAVHEYGPRAAGMH